MLASVSRPKKSWVALLVEGGRDGRRLLGCHDRGRTHGHEDDGAHADPHCLRGAADEVNARPAPALNPKALNAAAVAPSSVPRLAGTKKVTKRTADHSASMMVAVTSDPGSPRLRRMRTPCTAPSSQPTRYSPTETRNRGHWLR